MSESIIVEPTERPSEEVEPQEAITPAPAESAEASTPEATTPDKYAGKTVEQVIEMHQNLEKEYGRQANEVGTYRELVSSLTDAKRATDLPNVDTTETPVEVTSDDLFDNPGEAIASVVKSVLKDELTPLRDSQAKQEAASQLQVLFAEHPDAETIGNDPKFVEFVERTPSRIADAQSWVDSRDINAARRLLEDYKDFSGTAMTTGTPETPAASDANIEEARKSATESGRGGAGAEAGKKIFYRDEVTALIRKNPEKYRSDRFQKELRSAIEEGRFRE